MKILFSVIYVSLTLLFAPAVGLSQDKTTNDDWKGGLSPSAVKIMQSLIKWESAQHLEFSKRISQKRAEVLGILNNSLTELKSQKDGSSQEIVIQITSLQHLIDQVSGQDAEKALVLSAPDLTKMKAINGKSPEEIDKIIDGPSTKYKGRLYKLIAQKGKGVDWIEAKKACEKLGGRLAILRDERARSNISRRLIESKGVSRWAWIGGRWSGEDMEWQWQDGIIVHPSTWANKEEPEGGGGRAFMVITNDGELVVTHPNHPAVLGFIIEWKLEE